MAPDVQALADAIVAAHGALGLALPPGAAPARPTSEHAVYRAALAAATRLGFIAADAEVIARAWQRQAERTGRADPAAWPSEPADFGLAPWPRDGAFPPCPPALGLYAVLPDAAWCGRMARAGVPTVQLRFKSPDADAVRAEVAAAVEAVRGTGSLLFINDHWREAIEAGAYGVHLGQEDLDEAGAPALAAIRDAGLRLGLSTHGYAEMLKADAAGPSYLAMGAVYATTLKAMPTPPQGPARLAAYARLMRDRSLVAIGGIDEARLAEVLPSGVGSVGIVRAILGAANPEAAAARLAARIAALRG